MPTPYELATKMLGSHEHRNHSALTTYLKNGGSNLDPRTQAWCAAFVNSSLQQAGLQGSGSDAARSLLNIGKPTDKPNVGDIAVFSRTSDPSKGHVGFFQGYDANGNIKVLGGNQSNAVTETVMPASRLLGFRVPGLSLDSNPVVPPDIPGEAAASPGSGARDYVSAQPTPPVQEALFDPKAVFGGDEKGGAGSPFADALGGLDTLNKGIHPQVNPAVAAEMAKIAPMAGGDAALGGAGNPQAAASLLQALLARNKRPMGTTLMGGYG
jgi:uncharacterized protein (TIGR02594 family)